VKKTRPRTFNKNSPKANRQPRQIGSIKRSMLLLTGTWVFFALLAAVSLRSLTSFSNPEPVALETSLPATTAMEATKSEFEFPLGLYGAIALICTGGSILVYRRYQQKFGSSNPAKKATTAKVRARRAQRQRQAPTSGIAKAAPARQKAPLKRPKLEQVLASNSYAPLPSQPKTEEVRIPEVIAIPLRQQHSSQAKSDGLVKAMDLRNQKTLNSLLDR
jgi:hypothetical protein